MSYNNAVLKIVDCDKGSWKKYQLRIWDYLDRIQDSFWKIRYWPCWAQHAITFQHKNNSQMYNLFYFLIGNGLYPTIAQNWITMWDVDQYDNPVMSPFYKPSELYDIGRVVAQAEDGTLFKGNKRVFDMHLCRPVMM
jgi:hypothetical protein